jgi:hypothetical protein
MKFKMDTVSTHAQFDEFRWFLQRQYDVSMPPADKPRDDLVDRNGLAHFTDWQNRSSEKACDLPDPLRKAYLAKLWGSALVRAGIYHVGRHTLAGGNPTEYGPINIDSMEVGIVRSEYFDVQSQKVFRLLRQGGRPEPELLPFWRWIERHTSPEGKLRESGVSARDAVTARQFDTTEQAKQALELMLHEGLLQEVGRREGRGPKADRYLPTPRWTAGQADRPQYSH